MGMIIMLVRNTYDYGLMVLKLRLSDNGDDIDNSD